MANKIPTKVFIIQIDSASAPSHFEEWVIIWNDDIIHTGNWLHDTDTFVQGYLAAFDTLGYEVEKKVIQLKDDELYAEIQQGTYNLEKMARRAGLI